MSIASKEEVLFKEWQETLDGTLVEDGVICESKYRDSKIQLLFLMKETNKYSKPLRSLLRDGPPRETWDNVARWTMGITSHQSKIQWEQIAGNKIDAHKQDMLEQIAVINLKKTTGGSTTNRAELFKATKKSAHFLRRQIGLYDPSITVCCSPDVTWAFRKYLDFREDGQWFQTSRGVSYAKVKPTKYVIGFYHPQCQFPHYMLFYTLIDAVRELLAMKK